MSISNPCHKVGVHKMVDINITLLESDVDNSMTMYYSPDNFIKNSLFLVQSENLFNQEAKRPLLYQLYYTSVQYIAAFANCSMTERRVTLAENINLEEGWYLMPIDFAGWATTPQPPFYKFDEYGNWSFRFGGSIGKNTATTGNPDGSIDLKYHAVPPLTGVNPDFLMAVRWHFLRELSLCQNSIAQFIQIIESRYQEYKTIFKTRTVTENMNNSAGNNVRGTTNHRVS